MPRPRPQVGIAEPMQQVVDALQRVGHAKLVPEKAYDIDAPPRADPGSRRRFGVQPGTKLGFPPAGQAGRLARAGAILQSVEPAVAVAIDPVLHEPPTASQLVGDLRGLEALRGQKHAATTLALSAIPRAACAALQSRLIAQTPHDDIHAKTSNPRRRKRARERVLAQYLTCAELRARTKWCAYETDIPMDGVALPNLLERR